MSEARLILCPACGATNRVPLEKAEAGLTPICGRCKTRMPIAVKPVIQEYVAKLLDLDPAHEPLRAMFRQKFSRSFGIDITGTV
jgi:hypothetical protein